MGDGTKGAALTVESIRNAIEKFKWLLDHPVVLEPVRTLVPLGVYEIYSRIREEQPGLSMYEALDQAETEYYK